MYLLRGFPGNSVVKNPPEIWETQETCAQSLDLEDTLEEGVATHSSILAKKSPWTEEPGWLQYIGSHAFLPPLLAGDVPFLSPLLVDSVLCRSPGSVHGVYFTLQKVRAVSCISNLVVAQAGKAEIPIMCLSPSSSYFCYHLHCFNQILGYKMSHGNLLSLPPNFQILMSQ